MKKTMESSYIDYAKMCIRDSFHTFNTLQTQGKQIILTSYKPPKEMETLEERIRSRFEWGLMADIRCV